METVNLASEEITVEQQRIPSNTEGAAMILFGRSVAFAIAVALPILLAHKLTAGALGLYKQVFLVVNTALNVVPMGFGMNVYYFLPRERERRGAVVLNTILLLSAAGLLAGSLVILWPGVLFLVSKEPEIQHYAPLIGATIFLWIPCALVEMLPVANQELKLAMTVSIGAQILRTGLFLSAAIFWGTVASLIWAAILYGALAVGIFVYYLTMRFPGFWRGIDFKLFSEQLSYAAPLGLMGIVWYFQYDLHNYFVSNQFGAAAFAVYSIGCFQLPVLQLLSEATSSVLISQMAVLQRENQTDQMLFLSLRSTRKLAAVVFPVYAFLMVTGLQFIEFLFSARYAGSWPIFRINLTLLPLGVLMLDPVARAFAEYRYLLLKLRVVFFVLLLVALWWSIPRFGMIGAISSVVFLGVADRAIQTWIFGRALHFGRRHLPQLTDTAKLALSAAAAALLTLGARMLMAGSRPLLVLLVCGAVFTPAYVLAVKLLGVVEPDEMQFLLRALLSPLQGIGRRLGIQGGQE
jgi:O-antigen/teichoic acid export membrane protein